MRQGDTPASGLREGIAKLQQGRDAGKPTVRENVSYDIRDTCD